MRKKAIEISDARIEELSLVFANKDGVEFAPRNGNARVLSVKGGEAKQLPTFLDRFAKTVKGFFVLDDTPDTIDDDGDGAVDYEQLLFAVVGMASDLQSAMWMSDPKMRSAAIVAGIDSFLAQADSIRSGGDGDAYGLMKAGARHSKADQERLDQMKGHLDKIGEHADKISETASEGKDATSDDDAKDNFAKVGSRADSLKKHVDAAQKLHGEMMPKSQSDDGQATGDDNGAEGDAGKAAAVTVTIAGAATVGDAAAAQDAIAAALKAKDAVTPDASDYADPGYQDDKKKRYPLDTAEHVRAAASFFGKESNREPYTKAQQEKIDAKIAAAKKKFDIGDDGEKAGEVDMTPEELDALVASAAAKAAEAAVAATTAALMPQITAAKAEATEAKAAVATANEIAVAAQAKADALAGKALSRTATGAAPAHAPGPDPESKLQRTIKAQLAANPVSTIF